MSKQELNSVSKLEDRLYVRISKIKTGIVIDHIPTKYSPIEIMKILGLTKYLKSDSPCVSIAMNIPSTSLGKKHLIKIEDARPTANFYILGLLGAERPVTVNFIEDYQVVYKERLSPPTYFEGVLRCVNTTCISNSDLNKDGSINPNATPEPIMSKFEAIKIDNKSVYRCCWCGRFQEGDILEHIKPEITSDMPPWIQSARISPYSVRKHHDRLGILYGFMKGEFLACLPFYLGNDQEVMFWKKNVKSKNIYLTPIDNVPKYVKGYIKLSKGWEL